MYDICGLGMYGICGTLPYGICSTVAYGILGSGVYGMFGTGVYRIDKITLVFKHVSTILLNSIFICVTLLKQ